jgi:hypothetical protein
MSGIARNIIQTNIFNGNIVKICLNPIFLNLNLRRHQFSFHTQPSLHFKTLPEKTYIDKNKIITSIYEPNLMEYLFYSPVDGEIVNVNYDLLSNINNVFTKTYQQQDVIDKLCIAEIEIEIEDNTQYFSGYN